MITIPNERLLATIERTTSLPTPSERQMTSCSRRFRASRTSSVMPGLINLDFADVTTIMSGMGLAIMGTGVGEGETARLMPQPERCRARCWRTASVEGARGVIVNVTGGSDLSMIEVSEATSIIQEAAHEDANIIFGAVVDPSMEGRVKITVDRDRFRKRGLGRSGLAIGRARRRSICRTTRSGSPEMPTRSKDRGADVFRSRDGSTVSLPASPDQVSSTDDGEHLELDTSLDTPVFLRDVRQSK